MRESKLKKREGVSLKTSARFRHKDKPFAGKEKAFAAIEKANGRCPGADGTFANPGE